MSDFKINIKEDLPPVPSYIWDLGKKLARKFSRKVAPMFRVMNWRWVGNKIPNEIAIEQVLTDLLQRIIADHKTDPQKRRQWSTGRVYVELTLSGEEGWKIEMGLDHCEFVSEAFPSI